MVQHPIRTTISSSVSIHVLLLIFVVVSIQLLEYCNGFQISSTKTTTRSVLQSNPMTRTTTQFLHNSKPIFILQQQQQQSSYTIVTATKRLSSSTTTTTALNLAGRRNRGLEVKRETATPLPGDMELYLKAGPDGRSVGDCPFAHYVRIVLEEKKLPYTLKPAIQSTKPNWLIDFYDGKMPALRHRKECYVDSDVIVSYLEFFFQEPSLSCSDKEMNVLAEQATLNLFPKIAKYIKHTPDFDEMDYVLLEELQNALNKLDTHFVETVIPTIQQPTTSDVSSIDYYLTGTNPTLLDCSLAPKLYHMSIACQEFKKQQQTDDDDDLILRIPDSVQRYMDIMFERESFQKTMYPKETVIWGWSNARK